MNPNWKTSFWLVLSAGALLLFHQTVLSSGFNAAKYIVLAMMFVIFLTSLALLVYALVLYIYKLFKKAPLKNVYTMIAVYCTVSFSYLGIITAGSVCTLCQHEKQKLMAQENTYITYNTNASQIVSHAGWALQWHDVEIPIPNSNFNTLILTHRKDLGYEILLHSPNNTTVFLSYFENRLIDDIYATTSLKTGQHNSSPKGREFTHQLFGGPLYFNQLVDIEYNHTPDDFDCSIWSWLWKPTFQAKIFYAMILKSIATPHKIKQIYQGVGPYSGWLEYGLVHNGSTLWKANLLTKQVPNQILMIELWIPQQDSNNKIGHAIGQYRNLDQIRSPYWLRNLEAFLRTNDESDCIELADELYQMHFSTESIKSVKNICSTL